MSDGPRIAIGIATGFSAIGFVLVGIFLWPTLPAGSLPFYGLAAFCGMTAIACFSSRSRPWALRIIGTAIFGGYLIYAIASRGGKNEERAFTGFLILGLPALYLAVRGLYPRWGFGSSAFRAREEEHNSPDDEQA